MTKRQLLRIAKIAVASNLLWRSSDLRDRFGNAAINDIANTLLKQAKFPSNVKVPKELQGEFIHELLSHEFIARFPKIRAALAE